MRDSVNKDMAWAQAAMIEHWPRFSHLVGGGELISNESATSNATSHLDMFSGIDWFIRQKRNGVDFNIPMAARVQNADRGAWASFTIREKRYGSKNVTELQRREAERETPGAATPHFQIQAYVDRNLDWQKPGDPTGTFIIAGVVKESDLMNAKDAGLFTRRNNSQEAGRAVDFLVFWWATLRDNGYEVSHECGDGVSLAEWQRRVSPVIRRRKPCPGCGYFFAVHGDHRQDCTVEHVSDIEAAAAVATVFEVEV